MIPTRRVFRIVVTLPSTGREPVRPVVSRPGPVPIETTEVGAGPLGAHQVERRRVERERASTEVAPGSVGEKNAPPTREDADSRRASPPIGRGVAPEFSRPTPEPRGTPRHSTTREATARRRGAYRTRQRRLGTNQNVSPGCHGVNGKTSKEDRPCPPTAADPFRTSEVMALARAPSAPLSRSREGSRSSPRARPR